MSPLLWGQKQVCGVAWSAGDCVNSLQESSSSQRLSLSVGSKAAMSLDLKSRQGSTAKWWPERGHGWKKTSQGGGHTCTAVCCIAAGEKLNTPRMPKHCVIVTRRGGGQTDLLAHVAKVRRSPSLFTRRYRSYVEWRNFECALYVIASNVASENTSMPILCGKLRSSSWKEKKLSESHPVRGRSSRGKCTSSHACQKGNSCVCCFRWLTGAASRIAVVDLGSDQAQWLSTMCWRSCCGLVGAHEFLSWGDVTWHCGGHRPAAHSGLHRESLLPRGSWRRTRRHGLQGRRWHETLCEMPQRSLWWPPQCRRRSRRHRRNGFLQILAHDTDGSGWVRANLAESANAGSSWWSWETLGLELDVVGSELPQSKQPTRLVRCWAHPLRLHARLLVQWHHTTGVRTLVWQSYQSCCSDFRPLAGLREHRLARCSRNQFRTPPTKAIFHGQALPKRCGLSWRRGQRAGRVTVVRSFWRRTSSRTKHFTGRDTGQFGCTTECIRLHSWQQSFSNKCTSTACVATGTYEIFLQSLRRKCRAAKTALCNALKRSMRTMESHDWLLRLRAQAPRLQSFVWQSSVGNAQNSVHKDSPPAARATRTECSRGSGTFPYTSAWRSKREQGIPKHVSNVTACVAGHRPRASSCTICSWPILASWKSLCGRNPRKSETPRNLLFISGTARAWDVTANGAHYFEMESCVSQHVSTWGHERFQPPLCPTVLDSTRLCGHNNATSVKTMPKSASSGGGRKKKEKKLKRWHVKKMAFQTHDELIRLISYL